MLRNKFFLNKKSAMQIGRHSHCQSGMTLVEALVGVGIIFFALTSSIHVIGDMITTRKNSEIIVSVAVARNSFINQLRNDRSWTYAVNTEASLACIKNQTDCAATAAAVNLRVYDVTGKPIYPAAIVAAPATAPVFTNMGLDLDGQVCSTFDPTAGGGNPACPLNLVITRQFICPPGGVAISGGTITNNCTNPKVLIQGRFTLNGGPKMPNMNMNKLNFDMYEQAIYCPAFPAIVNYSTTGAGVTYDDTTTPGDRRYRPNASTQTFPAGGANAYGYIDNVDICRTVQLNWNDYYDSPAVNEAEFLSEVCIQTTAQAVGTRPCNVMTWQRFYDTATGTANWRILDPTGAEVVRRPSWMNFAPTTPMAFKVSNGRLQFIGDSTTVYTAPFYANEKVRFVFFPSSKKYDAAGNGIHAVDLTKIN